MVTYFFLPASLLNQTIDFQLFIKASDQVEPRWPGWRQGNGKKSSYVGFTTSDFGRYLELSLFLRDASVASRDPLLGSIWAPQMHVKLSPQPITFSIQPQLPSVEEKSVRKHLATLKMFVFRFFPFLKIILITHFPSKIILLYFLFTSRFS